MKIYIYFPTLQKWSDILQKLGLRDATYFYFRQVVIYNGTSKSLLSFIKVLK